MALVGGWTEKVPQGFKDPSSLFRQPISDLGTHSRFLVYFSVFFSLLLLI